MVAHDAPEAACTCGFHLLRERPTDRGCLVRGRAAGWGRLVEHEAGWRCEVARPLELLVARGRLRRAAPGVSPEAVAAELGSRYRCPVALEEGLDPPPRWSPPVVAALAAAGVTPALAVQGGPLGVSGLTVFGAAVMTLGVLGARQWAADRPDRGGRPDGPRPVGDGVD